MVLFFNPPWAGTSWRSAGLLPLRAVLRELTCDLLELLFFLNYLRIAKRELSLIPDGGFQSFMSFSATLVDS